MKSRKKDKDPEIVLLNSEGPILKAKKAHADEYVLYDEDDSIIDILNLEEFNNFIYNNVPVTGTNGKEIYYGSYNKDMKPPKEDIEIFIKGIQTFIPFNAQDGSWLSPVKTEREWQESVLKELFPSYPNAAPRLNAIITPP
jgi:hypothetical protein